MEKKMNPQQKHREILAKVCSNDTNMEGYLAHTPEKLIKAFQDNVESIILITASSALSAMSELELSHASQIDTLQNQIADLQGQVEGLTALLKESLQLTWESENCFSIQGKQKEFMKKCNYDFYKKDEWDQTKLFAGGVVE